MSIPGSRPCSSPKCDGIIIWLANRNPNSKSRWMPVDVGSLSEDDVARIRSAGGSRELDYDPARHVSHYRSCKEPNRFTKLRKPKPQDQQKPKKPKQEALFKNPPKHIWD